MIVSIVLVIVLFIVVAGWLGNKNNIVDEYWNGEDDE